MSGAIRALPHSGRRQGSAALPVATRVAELDWTAISRGLDDFGSSLTGHVLGPPECKGIAELHGDDRRFRSTIAIAEGQGLVFTTRDRPVPSRRGWSAAAMRHGVSVLRSGRRHTLGLVFHDAR